MQQYLLRRLLMTVPVLVGLSLAIFASIRVVPGDIIVSLTADAGNVPEEQKAALREKLGLNDPFVVQYVNWAGGMLRGDFGDSLWRGSSVSREIRRTLPVTVELSLIAFAVAILIAVPVGVVSAIRQDTWLDYVGRLFSVGALSMPDFWIGTMAVLYLSLWFGWIPPIGEGFRGLLENPSVNLQLVALPALILGLRLSASGMRITRSAMLEVLREDYIRTAWSKGLRERSVIMRHALRNGLIPVITVFGAQLGLLLAGSVVMETLFGLPGMGRLTLEAVQLRDYPVVQANVMIIGTFVVLLNLLVDLSYGWLDPRIRYR
ncbi:MAG: ABC transporter permease [Chloroflexi bacterium]|nr:ABC transporter permease [Chloroflexota bacterium]